MSQQRQFQIVVGGGGSGFGGSAGGGSGSSGGGGGVGGGGGSGTNVRQYHDTTYTKLFVGGLAWETQRDTMRSYFEQFGEILEAVVITDKNTGRSKGYGFVTFKDPEAAFRACQNPSPMIDGRRANCNLAAFGAQKPKPPPIQQGPGRLRPAAPLAGLVAQPPAYPGPSSTYFHQPSTQLAFPYSAYGYSGYSHDTLYPMNYYNAVYGGQQFSPYYTAGTTAAGAPSAAAAAAASGYYHNYYPYYSPYAQSSSQAHGLQYHYHPQLLQYQYLQPHHFTTSSSAGILPVPTTPSPLPLAITVAAAAAPAAAAMTTGATTTTVVAGPVIPGSVSGPSKVTGVASEQSSSTT